LLFAVAFHLGYSLNARRISKNHINALVSKGRKAGDIPEQLQIQ